MFSSFGASSRVLAVGDSAWVTLLDAKREKKTVPCVIMEMEAEGRCVLACPGQHVFSESGEWMLAKSGGQEASPASRAFEVDGVSVTFPRVELKALKLTCPSHVDEKWEKTNGLEHVPSTKLLQKIYWGSGEQSLYTDTEIDQAAQEQELRKELVAVRAELAQARAGGGLPASSSSGVEPPALPGRLTAAQGQLFQADIFGDSENELDEDDSDEDGIAGLMKQMLGAGGLDTAGNGGAAAAATPRAASPARPRDARFGAQGRGGIGGEVGARRQRLASPRRPSQEARLRHSLRPNAGVPGAQVPGGVDPNLLVQMYMLKVLGKLMKDRGGAQDESLDGLKVMKTLGRMRALKRQLRHQPARVIREFEADWASELGGEHKPWTWRDAAQSVRWGKFRSMHRVFVMLGSVQEELEKGQQNLQAEAQCVQCMKAVHQFALTGNWQGAWPYTMLQDPLSQRDHAGTEVEAEAILAMLRTREDLKKRIQTNTKDLAQDEVDTPPEGESVDEKKKGKKKHV